MEDERQSQAWYVKYNLDAYALGPMRFDHPVTEAEAIEAAERAFGETPAEVWPEEVYPRVDFNRPF